MGWAPPARSMMERRRWPKCKGPATKNPSASGPRWAMRLVMRSRSARSPSPRNPAMPHISGSFRSRSEISRAANHVNCLVLRLMKSAGDHLGQQPHQNADDAGHEGKDGHQGQWRLGKEIEFVEIKIESPHRETKRSREKGQPP